MSIAHSLWFIILIWLYDRGQAEERFEPANTSLRIATETHVAHRQGDPMPLLVESASPSPTPRDQGANPPSNVISPFTRLPITSGSSSQSKGKTNQPDSVAKWKQVISWFNKTELKGKPLVDAVTQSINRIDKLAAPYIATGAPPDRDQALSTAYTDTVAQIQEAFKAALDSNDAKYRVGLATTYKRVTDEQKSIYGSNNNFFPQVYQQIYGRTFSCVGIVHPGKQQNALPSSWRPNVSGALIAPNLLLTCSHDITDDTLPGQQVEVWFNFTQDLDGKPTEKVVTYVKRTVYDGRTTNVDEKTPPLDFSLLEIDPAVTDRTPVELTTAPIGLNTAVYVIGQPKGEYQVVHDSSHVLYPYEVSKDDYAKVKLQVQSALIGQSDDSTELTDRLFKASYEQVPVEGHAPFFRYYLITNGEHMPIMGADCDTFHGDSGGPMFVRNTGLCCGILIEGPDDDSFFTIATFLHHEKILPMRAINERLADPKVGLKDWPSAYHVTVK
jgi:hypothetical protein